MDNEMNLWLVGGGLVLGLLFGAVVQRSRFCMVAAISNVVLMRDYRQLHAYLAAIAIAVIGTQLLEQGGWVDINQSSYRSASFDWAGLLLGGVVFGFGSMLAGGCAGRTVVRTAEGNLGALITLLAFGGAAAATYYGVLEPLRAWFLELTVTQLPSEDASFASLLELPYWFVSLAILVLCIAVIGMLGRRTRSRYLIGTGVIVGLLVVAGWWITGYLSQDDFSSHRPASLTFAAALARSTVYVTTGDIVGQGFAVALLSGTLLGAALSALITRSFHWVLPDSDHLAHLLIGGTMMGVGAILAGGCNIGQGLSGMSTTSIKAAIAVVAIIIGMLLGIAWLQRTETVASKISTSRSPMQVVGP